MSRLRAVLRRLLSWAVTVLAVAGLLWLAGGVLAPGSALAAPAKLSAAEPRPQLAPVIPIIVAGAERCAASAPCRGAVVEGGKWVGRQFSRTAEAHGTWVGPPPAAPAPPTAGPDRLAPAPTPAPAAPAPSPPPPAPSPPPPAPAPAPAAPKPTPPAPRPAVTPAPWPHLAPPPAPKPVGVPTVPELDPVDAPQPHTPPGPGAIPVGWPNEDGSELDPKENLGQPVDPDVERTPNEDWPQQPVPYRGDADTDPTAEAEPEPSDAESESPDDAADDGAPLSAAELADTFPRPPGPGDPLTVAMIETPTGARFSGRSGAGRPPPRSLQEELDAVSVDAREKFHGHCAEIDCVGQALDAGEELFGAAISTARVRGPNSPYHGTPIAPCGSCQAVLDKLGISYR